MCGIVGAVARRAAVPLLVESLRRLEYRGYDSAGLATVEPGSGLLRERAVGRVDDLAACLNGAYTGQVGIAHTRWATHGIPAEYNAHPHCSRNDLALVHNGIIENHGTLCRDLKAEGYEFTSDTDSEVVAHLIHRRATDRGGVLEAVQSVAGELEGAYALSIIERRDPDRIIAARNGCPVVIGLGDGENFVASDIAALLPLTQRYIVLEDGDVADIRRDRVDIFDTRGRPVERTVRQSEMTAESVSRNGYAHFMLKEIHEQPGAIEATLAERIAGDRLLSAAFGPQAETIFPRVERVHIVACGTSYHAGLTAAYQIERIARIPVVVEIASEFRYRDPVITPGTLFVGISQSGETADTLAALQMVKEREPLATLAICNTPESSLVRESDLVMMTRAGLEIGVASTKAFTTQLTVLGMLGIALGKAIGRLDAAGEGTLIRELTSLPGNIEVALAKSGTIERVARRIAGHRHALFLGRGTHYPVAIEGALKLKEISYIHAEAYGAGELKHGPLALVDAAMPVVALAPNDELLGKLTANLEEVRARGGEVIALTDPGTAIERTEGVEAVHVVERAGGFADPVLYTVALQLLAYHTAVIKGTDVDKPRNLAKSVTVE